MKKTALMIGIIVCTCALVQTCSSVSLNPKRMACDESCAQAKQKCLNDAKTSEVKKVACGVSYDQCLQKCASEFR
jgi:hypothetical protein